MENAKYFLLSVLLCLMLPELIIAQATGRPQTEQRKLKQYTIEQATSERAQLHTMAFSGLAFITGDFGVDCFFPPGKVADFFGFQYMRDNDKNELGHNTDFLTRIANNVIRILNSDQMKMLIELANQQAFIYDDFAKKRMILIKAFRESLTNKKQLNKAEIISYTSSLYEMDAALSYGRAITIGKIINSLTKEQRSLLSKLDFSNSSTWPILPETLDKKSMSHRAHVALMTYASELFSWYAGSVTADVYFCPERHGTYFGGFYLKDYPAMGNKGYTISTSLTGDKGEQFMELLTPQQSECMHSTIQDHKPLIRKIVELREAVAKELRKAIADETPDKDMIFTLIKQYGALDGELSCDYAICFSSIYHSLTNKQKENLKQLRGLDVYPNGAYLYSDPIDMPENLDDHSLLKD